MLTKLPALFPWKHNKTKIMAEQLQTMEEAVNLELDLLPCVICGRTFLPAPLEKHTKVCEKNATRKRKIFDSLKQRVEGTDLAPFHQKSYLKKNEIPTIQKTEIKQSKWKEKHLELVNAIRAAKGVTPTTSMPSTLGKRSSTTLGTPTHERCPSCDRQFGPKAFDRHVEWCKEKKTTIHKSPASVLLAKERLEARTKYKVPPLTKSKRALNREKYSPQTNNRTESVVNIKSVSACALDRSASVRRTKNQINSKKSPDKMNESGSSQVEQETQVMSREKMERSSGDPGVKVVHSDKSFSKDAKKFAEPMKSVNKRLPFSKINTISVNDDVEGLTVSSLSLGETDTRKLVTWKDTLKMSKSENTPFVVKNKLVESNVVASPGKASNQIRREVSNLRKDIQMETFSNLASQSKNRKGENNFKVVVKEKKRQDSSTRVPLKRIDPGQKTSTNLHRTSSENLKIANPDESKRLPAGGNFPKDPIKININMIGSGSSIDGFTLTSDSGELTITNPISSSLITYSQSQSDTDERLILNDRNEEIDAYFENFAPHEPMPIVSDDMVFKDSTEAILYDEGLDSDYYRKEIATLKIQLNSLEGRSYTSWQDKFLEGQAYGGSPKKGKKSGRSRSASVKNSRRSSAKKQRSTSSPKSPNPQMKMEIKPKSVTPRSPPTSLKNSGKDSPKTRPLSSPSKIPKSRKNSAKTAKSNPNELTAWKRNPNLLLLNLSRRSPSPNKSFKSSSDAVLIKKDHLKRKNQGRKGLYSPRSADVTLRLSLTASRPTSPSSERNTARSPPIKRQEQSARSRMSDKNQKNQTSPKVVSPIRKRIDKAITKSPGQSTPTGKTAKKHPKLTDEMMEIKKKLVGGNQTNLRTSSPSSNEYGHARCHLYGYCKSKANDDIVTQYERCKAQCKDNSLEKVHTKDIGVSCLTRFRRDTKIVNCERFLEKNRLISMDLQSPPSSSEDTDTYVFPDRLASDKCCQTSSIESYLKMTFAENIAKNKSEVRRRILEEERAKMKTIGVNHPEDKNEAYFDSLDESTGSIGSEVFKDDNTPVKDNTVTDGATTKICSSKKSLKAKPSKSNMLYQRSSEDGFSEDSVVDGCENYHSHALSVSRIERGLRKCSSDVCLRKNSDTIFATSCTEVDLRKLASYECTSIRSVNRYEDVNLTSDEILEIAGEQFLQCLRNNSQIKTSTPISQRKVPYISECPPSLNVTECVLISNTSKRVPPQNVVECPPSLNVSECVPPKKRKLEEGNEVGAGEDQELDTELRRNIEQIKEKKEKFQSLIEDQNFKELVKNSSVIFSNVSNSEDELLLNIEVSENSSDNIEMKRILSTIEEASSNTSSGVTNKFPSNYNFASGGDSRIKNNRYADIAREMIFGYADQNRSEVREANLIDLDDDDSPNVPNGFIFVPNPHEILQPVKVSYFSPRFPHLKKKTQNTGRPDSVDITSSFSPRFLHLVRTIIHPPQILGCKDMCGDVEEEFLKISRAHCRKLLQLDKDKLNHILESEPLKLPKITTVSAVRGCTHKLKRKAVVKLPPVQASKGVKSPPQVKVKNSPRKCRRPFARQDLCKARIPIEENKAEFYNSEPDLVETKFAVEGMRLTLSPRPNSSYTKSTTNITTTTTTTAESHTKNINDYNPFVSAERQLMELLECDDFLNTPPAPPPTIQNTPRPRTTNTAINSNKSAASKSTVQKKKAVKSANPKLQKGKVENPPVPKRASVIDPPVDFRDRLSMLNDDFDAIENMINSSYTNGSESSYSSKFYTRAENNSFNLTAILNQRKYSDDISIIDPRLINENDNLSIPESLHNDDSSPNSILDNNYFDLGNRYDDIDQFSENFDNKMSSIEPDGTEIKLKQSISLYDDDKFIGSGNIDEFVIALSESSVDNKSSSVKNVSKPKKQIKSSKLPKCTEKSNSLENSSIGYGGNSKDRKKNNLASLKRSISLLDPVQKPKTLKNKQDVQNYFNEQEFKSPTKPEKSFGGKIETSPVRLQEESNRFVPKAEELFSVDDEMYEEYKKYEEMYLKEKEEKLKKEERRISDGQSGLLTASEDDESQQQSIKLSGDSAYGSLNRKTPKVRARSTKLTPLDSQRNLTAESPNSSSSESSPVIPASSPVAPKMSKFCHECGNRYPVTSAKFCVECGVKRLVL